MKTLSEANALRESVYIKIPVLIVQGTEDRSVPLATSKRYFDIFHNNNLLSQLELV